VRVNFAYQDLCIVDIDSLGRRLQLLQLGEIERTQDLPALWQLAINLVSQELSADRIVILLDDGQVDLALAAYRRIDPELLFTGVHVNLAVLKQALNSREVVREGNLQRAVVCTPVVDGEVVRLLVYADRFVDDGLFEHDEVQMLEQIGGLLVRQWSKLQGPPPCEESPIELAKSIEEPMTLEAPVLEPGPRGGESFAPDSTPMVQTHESSEKKAPPSARSRLVAGRYQLGNTVLTCRFSTLIQAIDMKQGESMILRRLEMPSDGVRFPESLVKLPLTPGQADFPPSEGEATAKISKFREARNQLLREGRFLARLEHRNLPRVYEVLEDQGQVFLVLEDFSGQTLEQAEGRDTEPLSEFLLLRYFTQLIDVLEYLHHQDPPVIHRDLRPDGILVSDYGVLKLAEFGLAKLRETRGDTGKTSFRAQGSPYYASAEQLLGEPSVPANDFYSLGCILFYLATKQTPPRVLDRFAGTAEWPRLAGLRPDLHSGFSKLIEILTEINPEHRCVDFAQLRLLVSAIQNPSSAAAEEISELPIEISEQTSPVQAQPALPMEDVLEEASPAKDPSVPTEESVSEQPARQSAMSRLVDKFRGWNFLLKRSNSVESSLPPILPLPLVSEELASERLVLEPVAAEGEDLPEQIETPPIEVAVESVELASGVAADEPLELVSSAEPTSTTGPSSGPNQLGLTPTSLARLSQLIQRQTVGESDGLILVCGPSNRRNAEAVASLLDFAQDLGTGSCGFDNLPEGFRGLIHSTPDQLGLSPLNEQVLKSGSQILATVQAMGLGEALLHLAAAGVNRLRLPYLLAFAVLERQVRKLCYHCRELSPISYGQRQFFLKLAGELQLGEPPEQLWASRGCPACQQTGFHGLQTIYEHLELVPDEYKVVQLDSALELYEHQFSSIDRQGFLQQAFRLALEGQTTLEEVLPLGGYSLVSETQSVPKGRKNR
jgi:serine/threonine protein kinase